VAESALSANMARREELTEEVTGPSCAEVPFAVKLTPLGALSLTSRTAANELACAFAAQLMRPTCVGMVKVLADKLEKMRSQQLYHHLPRARDMWAQLTSFEGFAMSLKAGGGNLGTSFSLTTYSVADMMAIGKEKRVVEMGEAGDVVWVSFCRRKNNAG
jgi:hypothetical protein